MKKILLMSIETIIFIIVILAVLINYKSGTNAQFSTSLDGTIAICNTFFLIIIVYILGLFSGIIYSFAMGNKYKDQLEFYARKTEKLSQQNEIDSDDKEALQRKIATLEIALENALKNKQ